MSEKKWVTLEKIIDDDGTRIFYALQGTDAQVTSWKRDIPHAGNRGGYWKYTSWWVHGREFYSFKDAKEYAAKVAVEMGSKNKSEIHPKCGRKSCFGYSNGHCRVLAKSYPEDESCPFFKTMSEYESARRAGKNVRKTLEPVEDMGTNL